MNREGASLFNKHSYTFTHSQLWRITEREREKKLGQERERDYYCREIILLFWGFYFGVDSISEEVTGFHPLWFP